MSAYVPRLNGVLDKVDFSERFFLGKSYLNVKLGSKGYLNTEAGR